MSAYSAKYSSGSDSYEAQWNSTRFWSPADHSAFHACSYNYSGYANSQQGYWGYQGQATKSTPFQCAVNLADYTDDDSDSNSSESDDEFDAPLVVKMSQSEEREGSRQSVASCSDSGSVDDAVSTTDASSEATIDSASMLALTSDEGEAEDAQAKGRSCVHARDALLLLRLAVGICAQPPIEWKTEDVPRLAKDEPAPPPSIKGDGLEWRRAAKEQRGCVTLAVSPNSWGAMQAHAHQSNDEEVARCVKSILNKLTIEKFDVLYKKLMDCGIAKAEHIELLVHEVFDKACEQHHFVEMYADLCVLLEKSFDGEAVLGKSVGFRRILLNQCQSSFEHSLKPPADDEKLTEDELSEKTLAFKKRVLGNMRLVGALLTRGMLSPKILASCSQELLSAPVTPAALESLVVLLTAVGSKFDDPSSSCYMQMGSIFDRIKALTKDKTVPARVRFLMLDLLELRSTSWANTKKATERAEGPMKIKEVHQKAKEEEVSLPPSPKSQQAGGASSLKDSKHAVKDARKSKEGDSARSSRKTTSAGKSHAPTWKVCEKSAGTAVTSGASKKVSRTSRGAWKQVSKSAEWS